MPYGLYYYSDPLVLLALVAVAILGLIAQGSVKRTFAKYSKYPSSSGMRAYEVASRLLMTGGSDAALTRVSGKLTDHFDPRKNTVGLSDTVYDETSIAALAVAAHEIGHVMQYQEGYFPIRLRNALVPVASIGSTVAPWLVVLGLVLGSPNLAMFGAILFGAIFLFQLVTLPVELNASARALDMLTSGGYIMRGEEEDGARRVLRAAANTYLVAALSAFVSFLRLFLMASRTRKRN